MPSSKKVHPLAHPKMLKDFLREELGPCSPQKSSSVLPFLETMLAKAFKAVSRSRQASSFRRSSCGVCQGEARVKTAVLKVMDIVWRASLRDMAEDMPCQQSGLSRNTSCSNTSSGNYSSSSWHESGFDEEFPLTWLELADQKHMGDPIGLITRAFDLEETWRSFSVMEKKDDKGQQDGPVSVMGFWFGDEEELYIKDWSRGIEERLSVVREDRGRHLRISK
ncbi:hypothetical protein MLD38_015520 [Melastoma candidum]|uniref:Uncharacterized protein n=1 Tax=Melastoma candidum TaxID=119954 RepID=A0ACB9RG63_9MYRT|nr:hypothetical protein MLD38_015520 [Melastoma candidum]